MILADVKDRLSQLGFTCEETHDAILNFIMDKTEKHILALTNLLEFPEKLDKVAIDMVCGEFLLSIKDSSQGSSLNLDAAVKSINEGDTSVSFSGVKSGEERLDVLINYLINGRLNEITACRRLKW